jgi:hypothetical protein
MRTKKVQVQDDITQVQVDESSTESQVTTEVAKATTEVLKIEAYSLFEFCQQVEKAIKDGWVFDFESNELFPTAFGSMLVAGLKK